MANNMLFTLYGMTSFDRSAKPRWLLKEMGLPYQDRWLDSEKKETETAEYLRINPLGRTPALKMNERSIFESSAICAYLADQYVDKGMAPSVVSPERMEYQQWMYFAASTLDPFITRMMIVEDIPPGEVFTKKETALLSEFRDAMEMLNHVFSKREYLVANRFGVADICVGYHLYFATLWPEYKTIMSEFPNVVNYLERLKKRPAAIEAKVFSYEE